MSVLCNDGQGEVVNFVASRTCTTPTIGQMIEFLGEDDWFDWIIKGSYDEKLIKNTVYKESDFKWMIDDQSIDELKIIMRAQFLQFAQNRPDNIDKQVDALNKLVVEWAAPRIMSEVQQYMYYLNDITHMPQQISLPVSMSSAGTKSFPLGNFM
jgi:hypothetical protein